MQNEVLAADAAGVDLNGITHGIIAAAIEVHRRLGPGLLESAYQECVCYELSRLGRSFTREVHLPLSYKGLQSAQLLTYLRASKKPIGLLINFNVLVLKDGIKRIVNDFAERGPC